MLLLDSGSGDETAEGRVLADAVGGMILSWGGLGCGFSEKTGGAEVSPSRERRSRRERCVRKGGFVPAEVRNKVALWAHEVLSPHEDRLYVVFTSSRIVRAGELSIAGAAVFWSCPLIRRAGA
jgi:hypothetical protein